MLSLVAALALADPPTGPPERPPEPTAARQCADAAAGSEIEVCLRVGASHPDELDGVATALRGHIDRTSGGDRDLLVAMLQLLSPEGGPEGARALGALRDPRAVQPLVHAARIMDEPTALEAVAALGRHPEALQPLAAMVVDKTLPTPVRVGAVRALGDLGDDQAADELLLALRRTNVPAALRGPIIETIEEKYPSRVNELERRVAHDGRWWVAIGGAYSLGYSLESAGHFGRTAALSPIGAFSGVAAGGTAGLLMGRAWPIEAGQAAFVTSTGIGSSIAGTMIGGSFGAEGAAADAARVGGLAGGIGGFGTAIALRERHEAEPIDAVEAWGVATGASLITFTAVDQAGVSGTDAWRPGQFAAGVGALGGLAAGDVIAPRVYVSKRDTLMIGVLGAYGLTAGLLVPVERNGSLWAGGMAAGALTGYALSSRFDAGPDVSVGGLAGMTYGGLLGAGIGTTASLPGNGTKTLALLGVSAGLGLGGYAAWRNANPWDLSDGVLVGLTTGWASWQAVGWSAFASARTSGPALIAISGASVGALLLTPWLDVASTASFAAVSLGIWGGYIGGVSAFFLNKEYRTGLAYALVGSDVGLALGGLAMSPIINVHPLVIGLGDAGGVLGGSLSLVIANIATGDPDVLLAASLGGAAAGFAGGALVGHQIARSSKDIALAPIHVPGRWTVAPGVVSDGFVEGNGVFLTVDGW